MSSPGVQKQAADTNTEAATPVTSSSCEATRSPSPSPAADSSEISSSNGCSSVNAVGDASNGGVSSSSSNGKSVTAAAAASGITTNQNVISSNHNSVVSTSRSSDKHNNSVEALSSTSSTNPFSRSHGGSRCGNDSATPQPPRPILAPSKLGGFNSSVSSSPLAPARLARPVVLAPPTLFGASSSSSLRAASPLTAEPQAKFKLKPSILGSAVSINPFSKAPAGDLELDTPAGDACSSTSGSSSEPSSAKCSVSSSVASSTNSTSLASDSAAPNSAAEASNCTSSSTPPPSPPNSTSRKDEAVSSIAATSDAPKSLFGVFAKAEQKRPVACSSPAPASQLLPSNGVKPSVSSFIFGQNLQSKVEGKTIDDDGCEASSSTAEMSSSDNIFSAAASTFASQSASSTLNGGPSKDLETSSRELAEKESSGKRKFEPVQVLTGEETESNVMQMNCKVYCWVRGGWQERGRGVLRLNDWGSGGEEMHSRLLVRTQGTYTVMLNTNIWGEMVVDRASSKSIRFTASDPDGQPVVYLVMGLPKEIDTLHSSLEWRISNAKRRENNKKPRVNEASV
ncbi:ran-binding protein 3 isoform X2 [Hyalella azteca]|uniref:Ran-binding protein 3 isoform X2 n=1 Tax=Hyalella azteca TaxID=294128 RepID=A0A8B7P4G2_HYAAZ|nr:ran-binding protein 3 isoform X2 [Hyalella azteca]